MNINRFSFDRHFITLTAVTIIAGFVLWFSRLILLFGNPIATLGIAGVLVGTGCVAFLRVRRGYGSAFLFLLVSASLTGIWMLQFIRNTGMVGDMRSFANVAGIFAFTPFLVLLQAHGVRKTLRLFFIIGFVYVTIYAGLSFALLELGRFGDVPALSVILQDPGRGRRIYSNTAIIAYVLCYQIASIRQHRGITFNSLAVMVTLYAIYAAQSRVAMAIYLILTILVLINSSWLRRAAMNAYFILFFAYITVVIFSYGLIGQVLEDVQDESLSLRLESLSTAYGFFLDNPIFGLGIPGDASFYRSLTGYYYFPDDLGGLGIIASYGLVGLIWVYFMMRQLQHGANICDRGCHAEFVAASHAASFVILTTAFSHNLFAADGGIIFALLFAIHTYVRGEILDGQRRETIWPPRSSGPLGGRDPRTDLRSGSTIPQIRA